MPTNIVEVPARGSTIVAPVSGDPVTDASITQGEQPIADRIQHLEGMTIGSTDTRLIQQWGQSGEAQYRVYVRGAGAETTIQKTYNAFWTGTEWNVDVAGDAWAWLLVGGSFTQFYAPAATTSGGWSDAEFAQVNITSAISASVGVQVFDTSYLGLTIAPTANALYADNIIKAWGVINVSSGTITVQAGFNVNASTTSLPTTTELRVQLRTALSTLNYAVLCSGTSLSSWPSVVARSSSFFELRFIDHQGNAIDLTASDRTFMFAVLGEQ